MVVFILFSVAANVLKRNNLELEGYRLDLKPKHPELVPSSDKKQLVRTSKNVNFKPTESDIFSTPGS